MFFKPIRRVIKNMTKINQGLILKELVENQGIGKLIIELNTQSQLFDLNVDSKGVKLSSIGGDYSPVTLQFAKEKGRPKKSASAINLFDTGEFYDSFKVEVKGDTIFIIADPQKDNNNLEDDWGEIIGLTDDSLQIVINESKELIPKMVLSLLFSKAA